MLTRPQSPGDSQSPYRKVTLTVEYKTPAAAESGRQAIIQSVTIRSTRGGPTMLFNATIPPGAPSQEIEAAAPALSAHDSYKVRLLAGQTVGSEVIAEFDLSLDWPAELVNSEAFLDPDAYDEGEYLPPVWPDRTRQMVFVASAVACVMLGACLLVRSGGKRLAAASVTAAAAGVVLWVMVSSESIVIRKEIGDDGRLLLVSSLRDEVYEIAEPDTVPIYYNLEEMMVDKSVVRTPEKLTVAVKPGAVLLFARTKPPGGTGRRDQSSGD